MCLQVSPDNHYRLNTLDLGLSFPFTERIGMRVFGRYWGGSFRDWHYLTLDQDPIQDLRIYTDRGPNRSYKATIVGLMMNVRL